MSDVGNYSVEPVVAAHTGVTNQNIIKEEHDDKKDVNEGKNYKIGLKTAEK